MPFLRGKKNPPPFNMGKQLRDPSTDAYANATVDVSPCNGISAILGKRPDRDDNERTRPVTTPSVRTPQPIRPHFVPLEMAHGAYDASLT